MARLPRSMVQRQSTVNRSMVPNSGGGRSSIVAPEPRPLPPLGSAQIAADAVAEFSGQGVWAALADVTAPYPAQRSGEIYAISFGCNVAASDDTVIEVFVANVSAGSFTLPDGEGGPATAYVADFAGGSVTAGQNIRIEKVSGGTGLEDPTIVIAASSDTGTRGSTGPAGVTGPAGPTGPQGDPGEGVPTGGTSGQVLTKDSGTDYDTSWQTPSGGSGVFSVTSLAFTADQAIATGTVTAVTWDVEEVDTDNQHAASGSTVTIATTGVYRIGGQVALNPGSTGTRYCYIQKNGTDIATGGGGPAHASQHAFLSIVPFVASLTASDVIRMVVFHTQGSSLNLRGSTWSPGASRFTVERLT